MNDQTHSAELVLIEPATLPAVFSNTALLDQLLQRLETEARHTPQDLTTPRGRKAIASLAYKIAQSKTALDDAGKKLNEDARAHINQVDAERRKIRERLDALRDEIRKPLNEWEAAEEKRIATLTANLAKFTPTMVPASSAGLQDLIAEIEAIEVDASWAEYEDRAATLKGFCLIRLREHLEAATEREEQAAELERLRAEKAARDEADRIKAEAEAADKARAEAAAAQAERDRLAAEAEAARIAEAQRIATEEAARAAREAEERAAEELARQKREADEAAERAAKAAADREAELQRQAEQREADLRAQIAAEKERTDKAAQAERDRIEAEEAERIRAENKRREDAVHRARIRGEIIDALKAMSGNATPERIADALLAGSIPHTKVTL